MKLARPDVFHPRIVLAGCTALPQGDGDDDGLVGALRDRGLHARWLPWDDPATLEADLVILRATWDYTDRLADFLTWCGSVRNLVNGPDLVDWNTDKRYLEDLRRLGVPVVPTRYFEVDEEVSVPGGEVVVKPAVGVGSAGAQRFVDADAAAAHAAALQAAGKAVLVQPYDPRIAEGETALVFLNGEESHAFTKGPMLPPAGQTPEFDESGTYAEESLSAADPDDELWRVGRLAVWAVTRLFDIEPEHLLYARVDVIGGPDDPRLLELELVEPSLGFRQLGDVDRAEAEREFALGVGSALERFGLGPLSHRVR
ncbi:ATP-grasp domain-containing protein [Mycobacterium sp. NPDC003449]